MLYEDWLLNEAKELCGRKPAKGSVKGGVDRMLRYTRAYSNCLEHIHNCILQDKKIDSKVAEALGIFREGAEYFWVSMYPTIACLGDESETGDAINPKDL
jgi:hypothetical protein